MDWSTVAGGSQLQPLAFSCVVPAGRSRQPAPTTPHLAVGAVHERAAQAAGKASVPCRAGTVAWLAVAAAAALRQRHWGRHRGWRRHSRGVALAADIGREAVAAADAVPSLGTSELELGEPTNSLEELLLNVDLPQPLRPVFGSAAWASFGAALLQMGVVAGLAAFGTFLEQGRPASFYASEYPSWSGIILMLQLDNIYSSPLFLGLLAWLAVSIIACTGTTQLPLARKAQRTVFRSPRALQRSSQFLARVQCSTDGQGAQPVEASSVAQERMQNLQRVLEARGFVVRTNDVSCPTSLVARRGLIGKFAPMVVHLAMLFCLAGGAIGLLFGASSEVIIGDGGYAEMGQVLARGRRAKGPLYDFVNPFKGLLDNTNLRVDNFRIDYRENGDVAQYYSKLSVEDSRTNQKLLDDEIYVNKPLRYGGATVYQADWALDRLQMYINGNAVVVPLKAVPKEAAEGNGKLWAAFLPKDLVFAKEMRSVKKVSAAEGIVLVAENMRNVQVYGLDKSLAGVLRSPDAKVNQKMEGMPIQFGESITVDGAELRLDRIVGSTGLIVKSDPGVPFVYLGFALLMPATLLSVLPFAQVWATVGDGSSDVNGVDQLLISGRTNRNQPAFENEMKAIIVSGSL